MSVKLIQPTDAIEVKQICVLLYGQPGSRKSSCAQTADDPVTLATDPGIYRAFGRKLSLVVDTWADVLDACKLPEVEKAKTINVDTLGMALEKLSLAIIADNAKMGSRTGGLTLQGYGALKNQFAQWVSTMKAKGKDLVFLCHEKIEKNGDDAYYCPDIVGGSYNTLMNIADAVGYMHFDGGKKVIDFAPTDRWMAKCPPCGWGQITLPDFGTHPDFLAKLLHEAKASMGRISAESAKIAALVDEWRTKLNPKMKLEELNAMLPELGKLPQIAKAQAWTATMDFAEPLGLAWDGKAKVFKHKEAA